MFADPSLISVDGTATTVSFPRVTLGNGVGSFKSPDGLFTGLVRQTATKTRLRHEIRMTQNKISADPLNPAVNVSKSASAYIVIDEPLVGFSDTELSNLYKDVQGWTQAQIARLLVGEY